MSEGMLLSSGGTLTIYRKATAGMHIFSVEKVLVVNWFEVPAPLEADPGERQPIYVADPTRTEWHFELTYAGTKARTRAIVRGLAHATAAAAITHAKAIVGVDPYAAPVSLGDAYDNLP